MKGGKNYEKMSVFEQIREGLRDSIAHVRGELSPASSGTRIVFSRRSDTTRAR